MATARKTITVAAGQITARLMNEASDTLGLLEAAIAEAADRRVDLLVLPECAYPGYLLGSVTSYRAGDHLSSKAFVAWLCERAGRHRLHIVSGFVEDTSEVLYNSAVLIDDRGREIGRTRKRFLWHADHEWFARGSEIRAFNTELGRIGIVICAETRVPEIIATLVADGAELLAMPTCWINGTSESGRFENPQVEFLIRARAREFDVPFICADKSGIELGTVGYVGQSRIVQSDGSVAAEAPAAGDAVIVAHLDRHPPRRARMSEAHRARLLDDRPAVRPVGGPPRPTVVAAVPAVVANDPFTGGTGESLFEPLRDRGVGLLLVNMDHESSAEQLATLAREFDIHAIGFPYRTDVFELGPARIGCVAGQWVRCFAASRTLVLDGAEVLMFFDVPDEIEILRARAMENRVFVLGAGERSAVVIGPDGGVLARTANSRPGEAVAEIDLAAAADKLVAPQTDIFNERRVERCRF